MGRLDVEVTSGGIRSRPRPHASRIRAARADAARPFVKWAGGKRQLLRELLDHVPPRFGSYHEPFVGGGALFFKLRADNRIGRAFLSDANKRLIRAYRGVRDRVERVIRLLETRYEPRKGNADFYYETRDVPVDAETDDAEVAAWLIFLNRTGYNGLYRVNSKNRFNVPFGDYANPTVCDAENLRACAAALRGVEILCEPFHAVRERAERGDFVYFDPPYVPLSATSSFTSYAKDGFNEEDQRRLRDVAREMAARGVHVLLSNSSAPWVHEHYADGFRVQQVLAARLVNSRADRRGKVEELVIVARGNPRPAGASRAVGRRAEPRGGSRR